MATIKLGESQINLSGNLPQRGDKAPDFRLVDTDMSEKSSSDFNGKTIVLNIFPSIDTSTCATSVRKFNSRAADLPNTVVICVSRDLPFAQKRFCGAEGIDNVVTLSDFREGSFGKSYGVEMTDGKFAGLHARAVVVVDGNGNVKHSELVANLSDEPDYEAAISAI